MAIQNGADMSIDTQSEEERLQMHRFIEQLTNSKLNCKGIMNSKTRDQKQCSDKGWIGRIALGVQSMAI